MEKMSSEFYLGLTTGILLANWETFAVIYKALGRCCIRQALRNLDSLEVRVAKVEFDQYSNEPEIPEPPKPAWQVDEDESRTHDEQPADSDDEEGQDGDNAPDGCDSAAASE